MIKTLDKALDGTFSAVGYPLPWVATWYYNYRTNRLIRRKVEQNLAAMRESGELG